MTARGTSNSNERGNVEDRRRRREWLVATYRADVDMITFGVEGEAGSYFGLGRWLRDAPACRCYRCGELLTVDTVTVDRIVPGCRGGTYRRTNIRPACSRCNSETGATVRRAA